MSGLFDTILKGAIFEIRNMLVTTKNKQNINMYGHTHWIHEIQFNKLACYQISIGFTYKAINMKPLTIKRLNTRLLKI